MGPRNINNNLDFFDFEFSEASKAPESSEPKDFGALLADIPDNELTHLVEGWDQQLDRDLLDMAFDNTKAPVANIEQNNLDVEHEIQAVTEQSSISKKRKGNPKRYVLNKPEFPDLESHTLVSKNDCSKLTANEINALIPMERDKIKIRCFVRDEKLIEAVTFRQFLDEYIWVLPQPTADKAMVYVDPKEYNNIKEMETIEKRGSKNYKKTLYYYGEPPTFVVRYGWYRKHYDGNNNPKERTYTTKEKPSHNPTEDVSNQPVIKSPKVKKTKTQKPSNKPPVEISNQSIIQSPKVRKRKTKYNSKKKSINKPQPLKHANGSYLSDQDLISLDDLIPLTETEKQTLRPDFQKKHQEFRRDGTDTYMQAVSYAMWKADYAWVHAMPSEGCVVYVNPTDYKQIEKTKPTVVDGVFRRKLNQYGNPPIYVCRMGAYRKIYDPNNEKFEERQPWRKKSLAEKDTSDHFDNTRSQEISPKDTNQPTIQITANPLYEPFLPPENTQVMQHPNFFGAPTYQDYFVQPRQPSAPIFYQPHDFLWTPTQQLHQLPMQETSIAHLMSAPPAFLDQPTYPYPFLDLSTQTHTNNASSTINRDVTNAMLANQAALGYATINLGIPLSQVDAMQHPLPHSSGITFFNRSVGNQPSNTNASHHTLTKK